MNMINETFLEGNLVKDPEMKEVSPGKLLTNFRVASTKKFFKRNSDELAENTAYVSCEAWEKLGELVAREYKKGDRILIKGELRTDQWTDAENQKRSRMKIRVTHVTKVAQMTKVTND